MSDGHRYITERLRNAVERPDTAPALRQLMHEARSVIEGRDRALDNTTAFTLLKGIVSHWDEFGHEHGLDEKMDAARSFIQRSTGG